MSLTLPDRADLVPEDTWALEHLFATPADAEAALRDAEARVAALVRAPGASPPTPPACSRRSRRSRASSARAPAWATTSACR
jgi:hypothetical protein